MLRNFVTTRRINFVVKLWSFHIYFCVPSWTEAEAMHRTFSVVFNECNFPSRKYNIRREFLRRQNLLIFHVRASSSANAILRALLWTCQNSQATCILFVSATVQVLTAYFIFIESANNSCTHSLSPRFSQFFHLSLFLFLSIFSLYLPQTSERRISPFHSVAVYQK